MSSEIILLIVGSVLTLVAIVDSLKINNSSLNLIDVKLRIPMGIFGFLLLIYSGFSYGAVNLQGQIEQFEKGNILQITEPVESVKVISPLQGDSINCRILTMGVYPEAHDKDIWVLLKPSNDKYYPQSDHTNTSFKRKGEWQVITRFGGDDGEEYDIIVYETDIAASQFFSSTIEEWKASLTFPGLTSEEIPEGAKEVDRISVSLIENCRGVF